MTFLSFIVIILAIWIFSDALKTGKSISSALFWMGASIFFPLFSIPIYLFFKFQKSSLENTINSYHSHTQNSLICPKCGTENNPHQSICYKCNNKLTLT